MTTAYADAEILELAQELLRDDAHWTQGGAYAYDDHGEETAPASPTACKWCAVGAIACVLGISESHATPELWKSVQTLSFTWLQPAIPDGRLPPGATEYNDRELQSHRELMEWFDRAIALARA